MNVDVKKQPSSWIQPILRFTHNPVIMRELTVRMRKLSSFLLLGFVLASGWVGLLILWHEYTDNPYSFLQNQSREIFMILNFFLGSAISIMVPIFSATSINIEYEQETWELLTTTPLRKLAIIFGKFLSSILLIWIMCLAIIPIYGICFTLGSISPGEIIFTMALFSETCIIVGLIGILCSIRCRKTITSITLTYIFGFFYVILLPFCRVLIFQFSGRDQFGPEMIISPFVAAICYFVNERLPSGVGDVIQKNPLEAHFIMNGVLAIILIFLCWWSLRKEKQPMVKTTRFRKLRDFFQSEQTPESNASAGLFFRHFPLFWKEWRSMYRDSTIRFIKAHIGYILLSLFICIQLDVWDNDFVVVAVWLHILFIPFITIPYAANCFRYEWDHKTWEILSTTTLSPLRIWSGKFFVGFFLFNIRYWLVYLLPLLLGLSYALNYNLRNEYWLIEIIFLAYLMALLYLCVGSTISLYIKNSVSAYIFSFFFVGIYLAGLPLFFVIGDKFFNIVNIRTIETSFFLGFLTPVNLLIYLEQGTVEGVFLYKLDFLFINIFHALWVLVLCFLCLLAAIYKLNNTRIMK